MTSRSNQAQRRAQAVAQQQQSADATARARRNRMLLWGGVAVVAVVAIVVAVVASGGGDDAKATSYETATVKVSGTPLPSYDAASTPDPAVGDTIPTLTGKSVFDGAPVTVKPNGKPQVVVFLAHWCPHCQKEVPLLVSLAKQGVFDGVDVTVVATGTNPDYPNYPPSAWLKAEAWPFSVMADSDGTTAAEAYGLSAYPYFVAVDADGKVAGRATGELSAAQIKADMKALKAGKPLPSASSSQSSSAN